MLIFSIKAGSGEIACFFDVWSTRNVAGANQSGAICRGKGLYAGTRFYKNTVGTAV
jgi:hypothetical protein